ncbi:MAG: hypothetical protein OXR66_05790 [Candidatus Woesearchaeota archaeon]|nr:hypothetical protein [Candidatus Woesearchaeota archaeon]
MKRGSYFFVIDAFIAGLIILGIVVVIFADFFTAPVTTQAYYTAEDFLAFLDSTAVRDYDAAVLRSWTQNGVINDSTRSLLKQLVYFNLTDQGDNAITLANLSTAGVPENIQLAIFVNDVRYYNSSPSSNDAHIFFSSKRIVLLQNEETHELFTPVIVEVQTWQ